MTLLLFSLIINIFISLPLSIASIVLGVIRPGTCDHKDPMGLDVGNTLLGGGIAALVSVVLFVPRIVMSLQGKKTVVGLYGCMMCCIGLFMTAWIIVQAVVLFRTNIDCVQEMSSHVTFALVLWSWNAFMMVMPCCIGIMVCLCFKTEETIRT